MLVLDVFLWLEQELKVQLGEHAVSFSWTYSCWLSVELAYRLKVLTSFHLVVLLGWKTSGNPEIPYVQHNDAQSYTSFVTGLKYANFLHGIICSYDQGNQVYQQFFLPSLQRTNYTVTNICIPVTSLKNRIFTVRQGNEKRKAEFLDKNRILVEKLNFLVKNQIFALNKIHMTSLNLL
jgi:hypothetical protein